MRKNDSIAVITGASSGIGAVFARFLASEGNDLILVARRKDRLENIAAELEGKVHADVLPADLSRDEDIRRVRKVLENTSGIRYLVNNAGFGTDGPFNEVSIEEHRAMMKVHMSAPLELCHGVLPAMLERKSGNIINVASLAGYMVVPGGINYQCTKAFLISFSRNLQAEVRDRGIRVQALCPGFTYTGFHDTEGMKGFDRNSFPRWMWMKAEDVVTRSLSDLKRNSVVCVPGGFYRFLWHLLRNEFFSDLFGKMA